MGKYVVTAIVRLILKDKYTVIGICAGLVISVIVNLSLLGYRNCSTNSYAISEMDFNDYRVEDKLDNNMDKALLLQEEEWDKLDNDEKMDVLKCIARVEERYLGLTDHVNVIAEEMENDTTRGYYSHSDLKVAISSDYLEVCRAKDAVEVLCHEMFHAAQHSFVRICKDMNEEDRYLYFLRDAYIYEDEFRNYKGSNIYGHTEYYSQKCEEDAREYAKESVIDIYDRIFEYIEHNR